MTRVILDDFADGFIKVPSQKICVIKAVEMRVHSVHFNELRKIITNNDQIWSLVQFLSL